MHQHLLQRVAAGEPSAIGECIDRYGGLVWSLARKLIGARADAEDAVQEVFIDLWRSASRFDPELGTEATFVATIARRRLIDSKRRRSRCPDRDASVPIEDTAGYSTGSGTDTVELAEEAARAELAMRALRPEQQNILRLSVYEGWTHQHISDHLQIPLGTVKTQVRRGLIQVRERMQRASAGPFDGEASS
ncbi:hypothetical protein B7486_02180 [cyanobacterium TDX16]|nr:hypothetical protein B7486_02180 [cyanobacterium TDX16]